MSLEALMAWVETDPSANTPEGKALLAALKELKGWHKFDDDESITRPPRRPLEEALERIK